jgi:UBX domain-containing protein 1
VPDNYTGPRTLDGRPAPATTSGPARSSRQPPRGGVATLGSISQANAGSHAGHGHDDDDDEDDEDYEDDEQPRDLFAGGEKSGLAVQDPNRKTTDPKKLVNDIVNKAKA